MLASSPTGTIVRGTKSIALENFQSMDQMNTQKRVDQTVVNTQETSVFFFVEHIPELYIGNKSLLARTHGLDYTFILLPSFIYDFS